MRRVTLLLFLLGLWLLLAESLSLGQLLLGTMVAAGVMWLTPAMLPDVESIPLRRLPKLVVLLLYFLKELLVANVTVARLVLRPDRLQPGIVAYPLTVRGPAQITWLANLITLTPGTVSVEVAPDRSSLFIHTIDASDEAAVLAAPRQFEALIREVTT